MLSGVQNIVLNTVMCTIIDSCTGEILVFYLPICVFYYLAKLLLFTRSNRIPCRLLFFLKGHSRAFIWEKFPFVCGFRDMIFWGSAPTFHGGSPGNSLQSDTFLFWPGIFIYKVNAAYFWYVMPDMSLPPQKWSALC